MNDARICLRQPAAIALLLAAPHVTAGEPVQSDGVVEEVVVIGESRTYANNMVTDSMLNQQTPVTSVLSVIDNLPGVSIQEGDTYGFDDWSTTVSIRGFQVSLDEQQIGMTIDGLPNGNSNYGGGAKANRYVDSENLAGVAVSQGTADIASRSNEALGGTLDFMTDAPERESGFRISGTFGEFDAEKYYVRYDTGSLFGSETYAWVSASHQTATDWVNGAAEQERDHLALKLTSRLGQADLTGYLSYDDTHEDNYQRLFSAAEFEANPEWDRLTDEWSGIPYIDQLYRRGWSTLRENLFGYLKLDVEATPGLSLSGAVYFHDNTGRGDWVPPYLVNVTDDAGGPESEFTGAPRVDGGSLLGLITFVDGSGRALAPLDGCTSSITFPYGGAGAEFDPACFAPGAIPVQSYRHTHYAKERTGVTADFAWDAEVGGAANTLRGGVWYEDYERDEYRSWHRITDTRVGFEYEDESYWRQYDRRYPVETMKWYLEDSVVVGPVTATLGIKQFLVDVEREDLFGETPDATVDSDSDVLLSGGVIVDTPVDGLELFAGYAENFAAIRDEVLERPASDLEGIEPETAENFDIGLRYAGARFTLAATYYDIRFEDRIIFLSPETAAGPDYIIGTNGTYFNAGGIESDGVELSGTFDVDDAWTVYAAYTHNDSSYLGTGDPVVDAAQGITPGNPVVGVPDNMFVVTVDWASGPFNVGLSTKYTDERPVSLDGTFVADDYWLTDAYVYVAGERLGEAFRGTSLRFVVNNLLDEDYLGGIAGGGAWIGAPRTVALTAEARF
tara:strand:- start:2240 stop:4606 length:2367 start_codon:yes stop_codon:yes gene_type:complete